VFKSPKWHSRAVIAAALDLVARESNQERPRAQLESRPALAPIRV